MTGQTHRLVVHAFHQAAIPGNHPGTVIDQIVAEHGVQMTFGKSHAHRHGKALPQRTGGAFHAVQQEILRVTGAGAAQLAEVANVLERGLRVAGKVQQRIDQHRSMAGGQNEPVAVRPVGIGRIELQEILEQHGRGIGHAHRHAGVAAIGGLHGVHGKRPDGIGQRAIGNGHSYSDWVPQTCPQRTSRSVPPSFGNSRGQRQPAPPKTAPLRQPPEDGMHMGAGWFSLPVDGRSRAAPQSGSALPMVDSQPRCASKYPYDPGAHHHGDRPHRTGVGADRARGAG